MDGGSVSGDGQSMAKADGGGTGGGRVTFCQRHCKLKLLVTAVAGGIIVIPGMLQLCAVQTRHRNIEVKVSNRQLVAAILYGRPAHLHLLPVKLCRNGGHCQGAVNDACSSWLAFMDIDVVYARAKHQGQPELVVVAGAVLREGEGIGKLRVIYTFVTDLNRLWVPGVGYIRNGQHIVTIRKRTSANLRKFLCNRPPVQVQAAVNGPDPQVVYRKPALHISQKSRVRK